MGYEKEMQLIRDAVVEGVELEFYCTKAHSNHIAPQFEVTEIDGEKIPEGFKLLVCFENTIPVDSPSAEYGAVDYLWRDYFGYIEIGYYQVKKGLLGKEKLVTKAFYKEKYSKDDWKNRKRIPLKDILLKIANSK